jgi:hypothetical protein
MSASLLTRLVSRLLFRPGLSCERVVRCVAPGMSKGGCVAAMLAAPTRVPPASATEQGHDHKNDRHGFHVVPHL